MICSAAECGDRIKARGLCNRHYKRRWRANRPSGCKVAGCRLPHDANGYCATHYGRHRRHGDPDVRIRRRDGHNVCTIDGCGKPHDSHGFCGTHLRRWRLYGDPFYLLPRERPSCSIDACERPSHSRRLCHKHYVQIVSGPAYRARKRDAPGEWDPDAVRARVAYYGGKCWVCRKPYEHLDHVKPLIAGGANWPSNIRPICATHNCRKKGRWLGPSRLLEVV